MALEVDDPGLWKCFQYQSRQHEVARVLVAEIMGVRRSPGYVLQVAKAELGEIRRRNPIHADGVDEAKAVVIRGPLELHAEIVELAAQRHLGIAAQDALEKCRAGAWHAQDENGRLGAFVHGTRIEESWPAHGHQFGEKGGFPGGIVIDLRPLASGTRVQCLPGGFGITRAIQFLEQCIKQVGEVGAA